MGLKQDTADAAAALAEGNRQAELQRQRELEAQKDAMKAQNEALAQQRKREDEQMEAQEKKHEGDLATMLSHSKDQRAANQARADRLQQEQERSIKDAIKEGSDALDKQRNLNQTEIKNKTTDHQMMVTRKEGQIAETEKKTEEKVVALKEKKEVLQEKLNEDKKGYHEKQIEAGRQHALEMNKHHEQTAALELRRHENALEHDNTMHNIQLFSNSTRIAVTHATTKDVTESHFVDAVSNTRSAALEVSRGVSSLETNALILRDDKPIPATVLNSLKATYDRIVESKLRNLETSCIAVLDVEESNHPQVVTCQNIARQIRNANNVLNTSLNEFVGSLVYEDAALSRSLFTKVQADNTALQNIVASLPSIVKSQHAIGVLIQSTRSIQLGGNYIQQTQTAGAIVDVPDDN